MTEIIPAVFPGGVSRWVAGMIIETPGDKRIRRKLIRFAFLIPRLVVTHTSRGEYEPEESHMMRTSLEPEASILTLMLGAALWIAAPQPLTADASGESCMDACVTNEDCEAPPGATVPIAFECVFVSCDPDDPWNGPQAQKCMPKGAAEGHLSQGVPPAEQELEDDQSPFHLGVLPVLGVSASVQAGAFQGEVAGADLPVNNGVVAALFTDLPEFEGLLSVRGTSEGSSGAALCFNLEATNPQDVDAFFFLAFGMPVQVDVPDPFGVVASFSAEIQDTSGDGTATVTDLTLQTDGRTAGDIVTFFSDADPEPISGSAEDGSTVASGCPIAGPTPTFGSYAEVNTFLSFTLSPGDTLSVRSRVFATGPSGDAPVCNIPAVRDPPNLVFADGFESGDTNAWTGPSRIQPFDQ